MKKLGALVAIGAFSAAWASDWPQWRGPNRDAVSSEKGLLAQWPEEGPPLLWELTGLGTGYSSVAVVGNRLFTMGDLELEGGKSQYIIAVDLEAKKRLWTARVGPPHGDGSRATPTVEGGMVYAIGTEGDIVCVEAGTGKEVWRRSFPRDFGGKMMSGWKYSESPLIDGERVICTPGGDEAVLAALDRKTGETIWKCAPPKSNDMGGAGYSSAVVSEGAGVRQYVTLMGRGAIGVAADDGRFLWSYRRVANGTANIPTPVVRGDHVFVSTAYGTGSALLALSKAADGVEAKEVYWLDSDTFQCHHGGFLRVGGHIYGAHGHNKGNPICLDMETGKVLWSERQPGGGSGAVVFADGHLYFRYQDDTVALIEADPKEYKLKGTFELPKRPGMGGPGWAHPVVAGGKLYLRHRDVLFCYDVKGS